MAKHHPAEPPYCPAVMQVVWDSLSFRACANEAVRQVAEERYPITHPDFEPAWRQLMLWGITHLDWLAGKWNEPGVEQEG